ncbi:MAG: DNA topoisomerase 3, partial [Eubacteriaceae bacterium]|nr:DNA topoisomerase 3 [Eubacteriaceae bacterium]
MNKKLILAEKPSVGRDIARVLKCTTKGEGSIEGNEYIVTWAMGHLVELAAPEKYNERYKSWNLDDLPIMPDKMQLEVISRTSKQFHSVKKLLLRKDVSEIIIATDAGREGELVARWIINKVKVNKPVKRLWISSVTDKAISDGFKNLKDGRLYENLYNSALARAESDWLVGINATRALTTKYNAQLSCGRVQTPTLNLVASRQTEIRSFVPKDFSEIKLSAGGVTFTWQNEKTKETRIFDKEKCDALMNKLKNSREGKILMAEFKEKSVFSPLLYDLTELQRDANRLFNLSAKETLSITQRLYENHKVLTYPRTDSRYIPNDIVPTIKDRLNAINTGEYSSYVRELMGRPITAQKHFVDDAKISDHHAIIPTEEKVRLGNLSEMEEKIFDLVAKRFLAVLYPPHKYKQLSLTFEVDGEFFTASGKVTLSPGWKKIYQGENILEE